jgi:hypothetical protein
MLLLFVNQHGLFFSPAAPGTLTLSVATPGSLTLTPA